MTDVEFLAAFENATLQQFNHPDHIRMAWLYLNQYGWLQGIVKIRDGIQHLARKHNLSRKYHETLTIFWAKLVYQAIQSNPQIETYDEFIQANPKLLYSKLTELHYTNTVLFSEEARITWVEPDRLPIRDAQTN